MLHVLVVGSGHVQGCAFSSHAWLESHGCSFSWNCRSLCTSSPSQPPAGELHPERRRERDRDSRVGPSQGTGHPRAPLQGVLELGGQQQVPGPNEKEAEEDDGRGKWSERKRGISLQAGVGAPGGFRECRAMPMFAFTTLGENS